MAEENRSFFERLKRMLSTSVVIQSPGTNNKLRVLDFDKLQTLNNLETNRVVSKSLGFKSTSGTGAYDYMYNPGTGFTTVRIELYRDYEIMDQDSIISSALDIYADESTLKNESGDVLKIKSGKIEIKNSLENLFFDILNIEFNLWPWIRNLTKYGDFYLKLDITNKIGVTNAMPLSAYGISRIEDLDNPDGIKFRYDHTMSGSPKVHFAKTGEIAELENYEVAHFRLLSDTNYLPYGRSMLEGARKVWKQIVLMEDAMMIHRIMRAPSKRVFKIDVGLIPPNEVDTYMQDVINRMKKVPYMDETTGQYNLKFNLMNMLEDFYLPVRGGQSGTEIDTLAGMEFTGIEDINYLKDRMFAALKIPKPFLGYSEVVQNKTSLSSEDARFARTIERIQRIVVSELYKIAFIHLYAQGYRNEDLIDFELELTPASNLAKQEKIQILDSIMSLAERMKQTKLISTDRIYKELLDIPANEIDNEKEKIVSDSKFAYRVTQIETAGQDPSKTKDSVDVNGQEQSGETPDELEERKKALINKTFNEETSNINNKKPDAILMKKFGLKNFKIDSGNMLNENNIIKDSKPEKE